MEFLSQILVKAGLLVDGAVGFNNNSGSLSAAITWESSNMLQVNNGVANNYADLKARLFVSTNGFYAERSGNTVLGLNNTNGGKEWYIASLGNSNADPGSLMFNNETDGLSPMSLNNTSLKLKVDTGIRWTTGSSTDSVTYTAGISVDAANRLQINTGTDGVYGDLKLNELIATSLAGSGTRMVVAGSDGLLATQVIGDYITGLTGEATASGPGVANVTLSTSAVTGKLLTGVNVTGGSISATDSILTAFGKLQNQINGLVGGAIFQSVWNASTNTPTLASGVGTKGYYYIVDTAGSTSLDGITDWKVGDWAIFDGTAWRKVDNTDAVVSVNGYTGAVSLTTSDISEGTNLYYTNTRARAALSFAAGSGAYNQTTGVITIPTDNSQILNGAGYITTAALSGYVPYTGATTGVNLGSQTLTTLGAATTGTLTLKNLASSASIVFSNSLSQDRFSIDDINNFNFRLNATPFALDNTYTRFSIIDALGTRFSINGDGALTSASGATFGSTVAGTRATFTSSGAFSTVTATNGNAGGGAIQGVGGAGVGGFFSATGSNPALSANNNSTGNIANFANAGGNVVTISNAGNLTAASFIRTGGTSSQFLKADGSVDTNTYLTTSTAASTYVPYTGATTNVNLGSNTITAEAFQGKVQTVTTTTNGNFSIAIFATTANQNQVVNVTNAATINPSTGAFGVGSGGISTTGTLSAGGATLTGALSGTSGTFSGNVKAVGLTTDVADVTGTVWQKFSTTSETFTYGQYKVIANGIELALSGSGTKYAITGGNVGIGTTSPNALLHLSGATGSTLRLQYTGNSGYAQIETQAANELIFKVGVATEAARFVSSGRLLVGATTDDGSSIIQANGNVLATGFLNVKSANPIIYLTEDGVRQWSLDADAGNLILKDNTGAINALTFTGGTGAATFSSSVTATRFVANGTGIASGANTLIINNSGSSVSQFYSFGTNTSTRGGFKFIGIHSDQGSPVTFLDIATITGDATFNSTVTATGFIVSSDKRYKNIISQDGDVYQYVLKSNPDQVRWGYVSQDVEKWMPEAVTKDEKGYGSVNYIDVLVYKVRQLEKRIKELEG